MVEIVARDPVRAGERGGEGEGRGGRGEGRGGEGRGGEGEGEGRRGKEGWKGRRQGVCS